jgi:hypothetical protein
MYPTIHILGIAHLPTIEKSPMWSCAYTQKVLKQCSMFKKLGYRVIFYGVEGSKVECDEHVIVLSENIRNAVYGPLEEFERKFFEHDPKDLAYQTFISNAIVEMKKRINPTDIAINPMGNYYSKIFSPVNSGGIEVCNGTPYMIEGGIGYSGIIRGPHHHHVFESNSWMSFVYGMCNAQDFDYYDTVIPNFYDPKRFPYSDQKEDYYLQVCRQTYRKGIMISKAFVEAIDGKLILAGQPGEINPKDIESKNIEYIGYVDEKEKLDLMRHAKGLLCPTLYNPPFEGVTVESMFCGSPVLTTNHGCFVETVPQGVVGYRCTVLKDWVNADRNIDKINPEICRLWAEENFSMDVCGLKYADYFQRFADLSENGWYTYS